MKIDFEAPLADFTGSPVLLKDEGPVATLKDLAIIAIKNTLPEDNNSPREDKLALANIGEAIFNGDTIDTTQAGILKERVCKFFSSPAVAWAVEKAIEG